ncbi:lipopolysaccharide ABC transporter substrate-binding protein LptA [Photorhabdus tasmaniensis]|uniref:Lipopolysaccharide export system protein LptA n=1 Tax=Photorhabdus tasmaniensis TaxID=1004159 RepID=A0ABX0GKJ4_9GAMM|nr:lipopolysaccharide ABC transporter substrate-binding protein LptA [Photorhabdus tasmaniensis]NHB89356.1 lipopolysaccharide ABC transporter substrate-binding protein LptA [Photorhabdus tasmaniensis]
MNNKIRNAVIASAIFTASLPALALKDDTQKPISIASVKQSLDITRNTSTFTENVIIKQGSIDIHADKVVVTQPDGDSKKMIVEAFGNPVTFYQLQDNGKPIKGHGSKMRYEMDKELVTLTGNAYLEQLDSNIKADRITYLVPTQQMEAFSDKGKRVTTILLPSQLQQEEDPAVNNKSK